MLEALDDAVRLGVRGLVLHPAASDACEEVLAECRAAGLAVFGVELLGAVEPGGQGDIRDRAHSVYIDI